MVNATASGLLGSLMSPSATPFSIFLLVLGLILLVWGVAWNLKKFLYGDNISLLEPDDVLVYVGMILCFTAFLMIFGKGWF
ncbi:MAG: hypothetical protein ABH829_02215 [archaeon]